MNDLVNRSSGFDSDVTVPRNRKQAQAICLDGKYALFRNIPHPHLYVVSGHVCHTIKDTLKHTIAHGMGVDWTQYPDAREQTGYRRKWTDIHGCEAMTKLPSSFNSFILIRSLVIATHP